MMPVGCVVRALSGKEKGRLLAVVGERDGRLLIADGRHRLLIAPKGKNPRHLLDIGARLTCEELRTDRQLRRALRRIAEEQEKEGPGRV